MFSLGLIEVISFFYLIVITGITLSFYKDSLVSDPGHDNTVLNGNR